MDELLVDVANLPESGSMTGRELISRLKMIYDSEDRELLEEDVYNAAMRQITEEDVLSTKQLYELLDKLSPALASSMIEKSRMEKSRMDKSRMEATELGDDINNIIDADQDMPGLPPKPRLGITGSPLGTSRRKNTPLSRKYPTSSAAEGARLRQRNIAAMTNDEFDAMAEVVQPNLLESLTTFAAEAGLSPQRNAKATAASANFPAFASPDAGDNEQMYTERQFLYDTEQNGLTTPRAGRKAFRQFLREKSGVSPGGASQEVPLSPSSPYRDAPFQVPDLYSPSRYAARDEDSQKQIDELLNRKAELQKQVVDKDRRLALLEGQHEKIASELEQNLDECKAELTMKKREIERLKNSEKNYIESLQLAEAEIERIGVGLSNSTAQSADLRRQLDTKTVQMDDANRRVLEHQTEIISLKSNLNNNYQQQDHLVKEHRRLELQYRELEHELEAARQFKDEAIAAQQENINLNDIIERLNREMNDLRLQAQVSAVGANDNDAAGLGRRSYRKYKSLQDELAQNGGDDMSGVDDLVTPSASSVVRRCKNAVVGTTESDAQELKDDAVRQWLSTALGRCSSEDLVLLNEVWKRIEYCDTTTENQEQLRRELVSVFAAPYKYSLKDAIRGRSNPTLTRIVDNVAGECLGSRFSSGQHQFGGKSAAGLAYAMANGQHTTAAIILYSVVVFCLGIITASYFNIAQPLSTSLPFNMQNTTIASAVTDTGDRSLGLVRQVLVVDDTPINKYYPPLRKRAPRSGVGEIIFYWLETLLWEDADSQIPT
ncbi:hypothetical protein GGI25_001236 [Coemansia spiralis]|uniref:Uncharacterized protein n=2 Tax=Coemansia TaxID=4863 RepID=A0A9W8GCM3_9FUNG|nr:hypothetical protein BX070DRAFT_220841 [Coemansia spiralis]KAJ1994934.1 hypothetical protein EDC05_001309 [Coemansia umbellata]KAJ2624628.1 hypothetical protein GGI26_001322 [Coemansia sp. RSA 1358]KAJ2679785.1 hypothetical protein GGI25_001236 [Coemansia spiralis]